MNAAVWAETDLQPRAMLAALQSIEARLGRVRSVPNAARTIDLDIIDMGGLVLDEPDLILPHPRAHVRRFVLVPLRDVAPRWRHPGSGRSVSELLDELEMDDLTPL